MGILRDIFTLSAEFHPPSIDPFENEVIKLNIDAVVIPLALELKKQELPSVLEAALLRLVVPCIDALTTKLSVPSDQVIDWVTLYSTTRARLVSTVRTSLFRF